MRRPNAAHTKASGRRRRTASKSVYTATPMSRARSPTGRGAGRPRLPGLSARVTTPASSMMRRSDNRASARSEYVAKSGVPRKTTRGRGLSDGRRLFLLVELLDPAQEIERGKPIDVQDAVEVIELVLERAREEPFRSRGEAFPVAVQRAHPHHYRPLDVDQVNRDGEAALRPRLRLLGALDDLGIDERE